MSITDDAVAELAVAQPAEIADHDIGRPSRRRQRQVPIAYEAGPVVKWAGGKTKLLSDLVRRMPVSYGRYYEPFLGGGALFFRVLPLRSTVSDSNLDLMDAYRAISLDVEAVIAALYDHKRWHHASFPGHYYATRAMWNDRSGSVLTSVQRAAAFIYLNKTCFNGLWRVNASGAFNVPAGDYADPPICDSVKLKMSAAVLSSAVLRSGDYRDVLDGVTAGDFVYLDPPYDGTFSSYTASKFGPEDQEELADLVHRLVDSGVKVMLSNADTDNVRALYADLRIDSVSCARAINSDGKKRGPVGEVIVTGGYDPGDLGDHGDLVDRGNLDRGGAS